MDATLVETNKSEALCCYRGHRAYPALNTWWAERGMAVHTEFHDGNLPAGFEQRRVLEEALALLPDGVETVRLRSDTAAYQHEFLRYCETGESERFGRIEFAIGSDVTREFKKAVAGLAETDWHPFIKVIDGREVKTGNWLEAIRARISSPAPPVPGELSMEISL